MSELTPELAQDVVTACQAGAEEIADALSRCLDDTFTLSVAEPSSFASANALHQLDGPGLAIGLKFGNFGFAAVLPESTGLLPAWYTNPDPTGESKLSTLAQELSMLLVPERLLADTFAAARVEPLGQALQRSNVADDAILVPLILESGENSGQLSLVWPLAEPEALLSEPARVEDRVAEMGAAETAVEMESHPNDPARINDFSQLPVYARSLLRIKVPVSVCIAARKESVKEIIELAPGSIIKFDKACDQPLHLCVGDQEVAEGEAVKVGDYFGFRLSRMLMPREHFRTARCPEAC